MNGLMSSDCVKWILPGIVITVRELVCFGLLLLRMFYVIICLLFLLVNFLFDFIRKFEAGYQHLTCLKFCLHFV